MIVYPAIDLRVGQVVRLQEGDPNRQTTFSDSPVTTAEEWVAQGATWIHMVNLDGAFADANDNGRILAEAARLDVKVQFGGGLRSLDDIARAIENGASRVVLGTIAMREPDVVTEAVNRYGADAVCVALDARDGKITTHGWQQITAMTLVEFGKQMAERGAVHALYTDVARDGKLSGVNVDGTAVLARETGLQAIASGGVSTLEDIRALVRTKSVAGVVVGMALYEKRFSLVEAIDVAGESDAG